MLFLLSPLRSAARAPLSSSSAFTRTFASTRPSQLARLTLVGRLGTDPEVTTTSSGGEVIKYVVGTSYGPKDNRQTSWFRVASFADKQSQAREKVMALSKG
jgi:Single-strand binding protein family